MLWFMDYGSDNTFYLNYQNIPNRKKDESLIAHNVVIVHSVYKYWVTCSKLGMKFNIKFKILEFKFFCAISIRFSSGFRFTGFCLIPGAPKIFG